MARKLFAEILKEVKEAPTMEDKVMVLQANNTLMLRQLLVAAVDPKIKFDVAVPSYKENFETDGYSTNSLYTEFRRLYIFLENNDKVSPKRKVAILGQILESIDQSDAVALTEVITKDLGKYGITRELLNEAFPGLMGL